MQIPEFYNKIEESEEIEGMKIGGGEFVVRHLPSGIVTALTPDCIYDNDWDTLAEIISVKREPQVLTHITRVCGYYSLAENWNKSKLGELADRHKGNYEV